MPFAAWRSLTPAAAAAEIRHRIATLPDALRRGAIAWQQSEEALARELAAASPNAPLQGVPFFVKDLFDVAGVPTNAGSAFLSKVRVTRGDSTLVQALRNRGAAVAGKAQMVEFAAGLTGENRTYGDCPHPSHPERLSGGSSSGSAALVAAGVVPLALGSDTGGSVRVPAAFCGIYGFRLTPGDEFVADAFPLSPTCDTAGWFTGNAIDMRAVLEVLVGASGKSAGGNVPPRGVFLGAGEVVPGAQREVDRACRDAAAEIAQPIDAATRDALIASWRNSIDAYSAVVMHEANAVHRAWLEAHRSDYDPAIWQRFVAGGTQPAEAIAAARAEFTKVRAAFDGFFRTHDFLVMPCAPMPAFTKAEATPEARRQILTFTAPASLAGLPVLTIPVALPSGLTAGLQVIAAKPNSAVFDWVLGRASSAAL